MCIYIIPKYPMNKLELLQFSSFFSELMELKVQVYAFNNNQNQISELQRERGRGGVGKLEIGKRKLAKIERKKGRTWKGLKELRKLS